MEFVFFFLAPLPTRRDGKLSTFNNSLDPFFLAARFYRHFSSMFGDVEGLWSRCPVADLRFEKI